ncbi:OsmC family protein [Schleiferiaceae bacterium]|nr:OsmC family protein [Schleiferiaceae bacterium]
MKITLERIDEHFGFKARAGNHEMVLDTATEIGGNDQGFRPMELMLISLAGCSAIDVVHILKKGKYLIHDYNAEVYAERREELPRIFSSIDMIITVDTDAPDTVLERAAKLTSEKYCSAYAVLEASTSVTLKLVRDSH